MDCRFGFLGVGGCFEEEIAGNVRIGNSLVAVIRSVIRRASHVFIIKPNCAKPFMLKLEECGTVAAYILS